jgi:hypothetical protein
MWICLFRFFLGFGENMGAFCFEICCLWLGIPWVDARFTRNMSVPSAEDDDNEVQVQERGMSEVLEVVQMGRWNH